MTTTTVYTAYDGTTFYNYKTCEDYEYKCGCDLLVGYDAEGITEDWFDGIIIYAPEEIAKISAIQWFEDNDEISKGFDIGWNFYDYNAKCWLQFPYELLRDIDISVSCLPLRQ